MFKKILLPTDGSRHSAEAARFAADLAVTHDGIVHPLVAVEYQYITGEDISPEMTAAIRKRIDHRAHKALDAANAALREGGARTDDGRIVEGPAPEAILKEAEEGEYDVIVLSSRGVSVENGHQRLLGSCTERVLHGAPCPVLVIRGEPLTKP